MEIGILYNIFVCLITGLVSFIVFFALRKKRKQKNLAYSEGLDYFCLLLGLVWLSVAARFLLSWLGYNSLSTLVFKWVIGPLGYLHLIPGFYYLSWSFFGDKNGRRLLFNVIFTLAALVAVFTLFKHGFKEAEATYWGSKIEINSKATSIFVFGIFLPGFLLIMVEFVRRLVQWRKSENHNSKQMFGFSLGFLIYGLTGVFERAIWTQGWQMLLVRIGIMMSPLILYFSTTLEEESDQ